MEKMLKDAAVEVEVLRKGLEARDEALRAMKEEVDRSVDVLSHAAENREVLVVSNANSLIFGITSKLVMQFQFLFMLRSISCDAIELQVTVTSGFLSPDVDLLQGYPAKEGECNL